MNKDIIEKLCKQNIISKEGCQWLKLAVDPFHDYELQVSGLPDANSGESAVLEIKKTMNLAKPSGVTGNWDCHLISTPYHPGADYASSQGDIVNGAVQAGTALSANSHPISTLAACSVTSGDDTFGAVPSVYEYNSLNTSNFTVSGEQSYGFRVISQGFEAVNSTANINLQGSVTCYNSDPSCNKTTTSYFSSTPAFKGDWETMAINGPPNNLSAAKQFKNSVSFEAKQGVYCVNHIDLNNSTPARMRNGKAVFYTNTGNDCLFAPNQLPAKAIDSAVDLSAANGQFAVSAANLTGAYFSGLSEETTLFVTMRCTIEIFPTVDGVYKAVASPSPALDSRVLELYSYIVRELPPGVPRHENDFGTWFKKALHLANKGAMMLAPVIGKDPRGQALLTGLAATDAIVSSKGKNKKKMKELAKQEAAKVGKVAANQALAGAAQVAGRNYSK